MAEETTVDDDDPIIAITKAIQAATADGQKIAGHFGAVNIEGQHRVWWNIRSGNAVTKLLSNPEYKVAQILSALGSEVRLSILRTLLEGSKTAAELVTELGFRTTGQAYHHLKELERAGYVELRGGRYHFNLEVGQVYLIALALAADAGAETPEA